MTSAAVAGIAPVVKVNGTELKTATLDALIGLRISSGLRLPSRARLEFLDDGFAVSGGGTFALGAAILVTTDDGTKLFTGEVTGVELNVELGAPNLTVIADDAAYKMTLGNKVRTFTEVPYSSIVGEVASGHGLKVKSTSTGGPQPYVLQTDSDFGFLTEIADRVAYDWWVDAAGMLQFHPMGSQSGTVPKLSWDSMTGNLKHFSVRASALHPQQVTANGWDPEAKQPVTAQNKRVSARPTSSLVKPFLAPSALKNSSEVSTAFHMFSTGADGTGLATSLASRSMAGAVVAEGVCQINPAIAVGHPVSVQEVGPASGTYPVTEVEHTYSASGFDTRFVAGEREPSGLVDTLSTSSVSSFRQDALVVGVVTNVGDAQSPIGHIRVKYPTLGSQVESAWARVVSMGAGPSRGSTFLPEVNDEVIVGFEGGAISRPLVLGGLYSAEGAALDYGVVNGAIDRRQIVSRLGHVVELGDGKGPADQHIWLTLAGGQFFVKLGKDGLSANVPSGQPISIAAGNTKIDLDKEGNIALSGNQITLTAKQDVNIEATNIKLKSKASSEISAAAQLKMSANAGADLSSSGITSVKGSMVKIN